MEKYHELLIGRINENIARLASKTAYTIGEQKINYAQMNSMANCIAAGIVKAIKPEAMSGDKPVRIGICLPRNEHFVPCILAAVKLGCGYVPIDVATPELRKQFITDDAQLDYLITTENLPQLLQTEPIGQLPDYGRPISEAYMIYTSGTTGNPKGVSLPYKALYSYMQTITRPDNFNISEKSVILQFASLNFDISVLEIFSMLYYGATLVITQDEDRYDATRLHDLMIRTHITYCFLPPSLLAIFPDFNFPDMDTLSAGGEAIPHSLTQKIAGKYPYRFVNGYGPTESTCITTTHEIQDEDDWQNIGKPVPGVVCYVVDEKGQLVKPGEKGELLISGMQLTNGYWNRPELNEKAFFENPWEKEHDGIDVSRVYHSGDLVTLNEDGSFNYIGRMDSQIKLNGFRIEIGEITTRIEMHNRVARAFTRVEEINNNHVLVTYVCTKDKRDYLTDIKEYVAKYLPEYMVPTFWNHVEEFTLNLNGKIDKNQLCNAASTLTTNTTPLTSDEDTLMREVASVLGLKSINVEVDLIEEFGLTSLQVMSIVADLTTIGFYVQASDFTHYKSIREIIKNRGNHDHYWYNDDDNTTKPVIIFLAGFTGFSYMYNQFVDRLTDRFSIYVVEAYQQIIGPDRFATTDELMDLYTERIQSVIERHTIAAISGVCYGGEHALYLAHRLYHDKAYKPAVVCLDGEVDRDITPEKNPVTWFPFFSEELNKHRTEQDDILLRSLPDFHYEGKVVSFVSSEFVDCYSYLDPNPSEYKIDCMKQFLASAPARWKNRYPDCEVIMFPTNHDLFWRTEPSLTMITDCFNRIGDELG